MSILDNAKVVLKSGTFWAAFSAIVSVVAMVFSIYFSCTSKTYMNRDYEEKRARIVLEKAYIEETPLLNDPFSCTFVLKNIGGRSAQNLKSKVYFFSENDLDEYIAIREKEVPNIIHPGAEPAWQVGIAEFKGLDISVHYFYLTFEYTDTETSVTYGGPPYYLKWLGLKEGKGKPNLRHVSSQEIVDKLNNALNGSSQ